MTETQFRDLCRDISLALQVEHAESLAEQGRITVDGVDMALFFNDQEESEMLACYVDLGEINPHTRSDAYAHLLTLNLMSGSKTTGVYALDPNSRNALFIVHFYHPEELDGETMAQTLRFYAAQANQMRGVLLNWPQQASGFAQAQAEPARPRVDLA
jgi:hypothetical protein